MPTLSNRDRFYEIISPLFTGSKFTLVKPTSGKYREKIIDIINKETGDEDFQLWCHKLNDRLDLYLKDFSIRQLPESLRRHYPKPIPNNIKWHGYNATSFRCMDEEVLIATLKYIATELI